MATDIRIFKECLGCFSTGVTIISTIHNDLPMGVTINSFSSVSLTPPLVQFSLKKGSYAYEAFNNSDFFAVNILSQGQRSISERFSTPVNNWDDTPYRTEKSGAPILDKIIAYIECDKEKVYEGGDHSIFLGRIVNMKKVSDAKPLIFFQGEYHNL